MFFIISYDTQERALDIEANIARGIIPRVKPLYPSSVYMVLTVEITSLYFTSETTSLGCVSFADPLLIF